MSDNPLPLRTQPAVLGSDRIWFDPVLIGNACSVQYSNAVFAGLGTQQVAPANARRWAIGFFQGTAPQSIVCAPWPDVGTFSFQAVSLGSSILWFKLFDYGPLILNSWFINAPGATTVRVVELLRL